MATAVVGAISAAFTAITSSAIGAFAVRLVAGVAVSFLARQSRRRPNRSTRDNGRLVNGTDPAAPHDFPYGEVRKGGPRTYSESTGANNLFLHVIFPLAGFEVEEIGDIYINDEVVTLDGNGFVQTPPYTNFIRIKKHLGGPDQVVDPDLLAESSQIDPSFVGHGIAYIYVRLTYNSDVFPNGIPLITAVVKGAKVYDPRTDTTAYSANAALCSRDYITAPYGLDDQSVDDTVFSVAANVSDEDVPLAGGGTEKRYETHGVILADQARGENLQDMMSACAGTLFWGQGNWQLKPGYWTPPVKNFTVDDLRGPISIQTRLNKRETFNAAAGTFADKEQDYIVADFPRVSSEPFLNEDGGDANTMDLDLPMTTSSAAAQRLARQTLFRSREQITISAPFMMSAFEVQVGDTVSLTIDKYGWTAKPFEVQAWSFAIDPKQRTLGVDLTLRETSQAAFDWNANERDILRNNTTLLRFNEPPEVGISVTTETEVFSEKVQINLIIDVTSEIADWIDFVEVQYKPTGAARWLTVGRGDIGEYIVSDVAPGFYSVRARARSTFGFRGNYFTLDDVQVIDLSADPNNVDGLTYDVNGNTITLDWEPVNSEDLSYYKVRHAVELSGAIWSDATTAKERVARPGTSVALPAEAGTYLVRAISKRGKQSALAATAVVRNADLPDYPTSLTDIEDPSFSGAKTNVVVTGNRLRLDSYSSAPTTGIYDFSGSIDTGAVRVVRAKMFCKVARFNNGSGLFDDLPGLFDNLPGLFDDLTGATDDFADTNVEFYISATDDDPSGSPNWGAWRKFRATEISGRAFRFRVILTTETDDVTPEVEELVGIVEY